MNKLLIVLLAVCLVSVHAFVKRDAPATATEKNYFEDFQKSVNEIAQKISEDVKAALSPEELQKKTSDALDSITKAVEDIKSKISTPEAKA